MRCLIFSRIKRCCSKLLGKSQPEAEQIHRVVIPREQHSVSRKQICEPALKVLYRLHRSGYQAFLVGGGVRDLLLGKSPKDFDVATDARPETVRKLFRNCRLIGKRFRLAHILFGREVIEVATFRGHHSNGTNPQHSKQSDEGMLLRDNVYGDIEEDAQRRDFTINALYYDISDYSIHDFCGGLHDLEARRIELIGDPETRYREDPVRMLRAIRFACKLDMQITERTRAPIHPLRELLREIPAARMFEEANKLFLSGHGVATLAMLRDYDLFRQLFPQTEAAFEDPEYGPDFQRFVDLSLADTDKRVAEDKQVNPAFMFAALLWGPLQLAAKAIQAQGEFNEYDSYQCAMNDVLERQLTTISIPRRFTAIVRDIWSLQLRMPQRNGKKAYRLLEHNKFRAGFDFLALRARIDGELTPLVQWWDTFREADKRQQGAMVREVSGGTRRNFRRPRRRTPRRKPSGAAQQ
ncbi:polynucleotide adenylyltransferase PcnB [Dongshaea marina]|uniref:polynucleotide adenylyltransferase PcnB n=1 Tax=Dongshaea marina TaxID=2047966 RepID=UPI000D3EB226|nr:polynucleotide adenylyltransferase PcnB [Dongshaea marina]